MPKIEFKINEKFFLFATFAIICIIYFLSSPGHTPFDYFTRLSRAFLQGKYYLTENPSWLSELIPAGVNRFFVVYPPMPAVLSMPFVLIFGKSFHQEYLAILLGSAIPVIYLSIAKKINKNKLFHFWSVLFVAFGNILWYLSSVGSSWYLGQVSAAFFLSLTLLETLGKKRVFLVGLFLGAAYMSRIHIILTVPLFVFLLTANKKDLFKNLFIISLGILPFFVFNSTYNFIRFQTILDKSYVLIPGLYAEPWYQKGLFHISYIPDHLKVIFLSLPKIISRFPYIIPSWGGLAIWITTPAFIFALFNSLKEKAVQTYWVSVGLISLVIFSHGGTGFTQFGYRFAVDFYPFLFLLTIMGVSKMKSLKLPYLLLLISIIVNFWGVLWINKFGWVEF